MAKKTDVPSFGPLQGVRVTHVSSSVAGPCAVDLMADWGADVVWFESAKVPDLCRSGTGTTMDTERRNMRNLCIDVSSPEGREVLLRKLKDTDIFLESSKPGQYQKWGLDDETLWAVNPKLVIVHISGFGQQCDPDYYGRASFDGVAQAYGGMMYINSLPGMPATPLIPTVADYYTALFACSSALAAYARVLRGGDGESVDVAQYETILRLSSVWGMDDWNLGIPFDREKNHSGNGGTAGYRSYMCKDDTEVYVLIFGSGVVKRTFEYFDLPYGTETAPVGTPRVLEGSEAGELLDKTLTDYFAQHTCTEAEQELSKVGIPIAPVLKYSQMVDHPLFKSREALIQFENCQGETITASNVVPKFVKNPGRVWRGGPTVGLDNEDILGELGYSDEEVAELYEKKLIVKRSNTKML